MFFGRKNRKKEYPSLFSQCNPSSYGSTASTNTAAVEYSEEEILQLARDLFDNYLQKHEGLGDQQKALTLRNAETERLLHSFLKDYRVKERDKFLGELNTEITKLCSLSGTFSSPILKYIKSVLNQIPLPKVRSLNSTK